MARAGAPRIARCEQNVCRRMCTPCSPKPATRCAPRTALIRWTTRIPAAQYAQVVIAAQPASRLTDKSVERPFVVAGEFSDRDLIDLVKFIRRSPEPDSKMVQERDGTIHGE